MGLSDTPDVVRLHHPTPDLPHFWITADLSSDDGDNYAAQSEIERRLHPSAATQVTWDSESGQFFANANTYLVARLVAEAAAALHGYDIREVLTDD